jgi:hypothetical protein
MLEPEWFQRFNEACVLYVEGTVDKFENSAQGPWSSWRRALSLGSKTGLYDSNASLSMYWQILRSYEERVHCCSGEICNAIARAMVSAAGGSVYVGLGLLGISEYPKFGSQFLAAVDNNVWDSSFSSGHRILSAMSDSNSSIFFMIQFVIQIPMLTKWRKSWQYIRNSSPSGKFHSTPLGYS